MSNLDDNQTRALKQDIRIIEACPGAGKTRTIVERFIAQSSKAERGVALVSFTNAAVGEALRRCGSEVAIQSSPNFVGTFDSFLRRYVVTPHLIRRLRCPPRYLDSWDDLSGDYKFVRSQGINGQGISLSKLRPDSKGQHEFASLDSTEEAYLASVQRIDPGAISLKTRAQARVNGLLAKGIYDCDHTRLLALQILNGSVADIAGRRLAARFEEIIIDEFQDCSDVEYLIRAQLIGLGVRVVVVADPDQGIYEFRNAKPQLFSDLVSSSDPSSIVRLENNYRSSPAVCELITSLRCISSAPILPAADFGEKEVSNFVYVLSGSTENRLARFRELLSEYDCPLPDAMILAPTRKQAAALAGYSRAELEFGTGGTGKVLSLLSRMKSGARLRGRGKILDQFCEKLLDCLDWSSAGLDDTSLRARLDYLELDKATFRVGLSSLLSASTSWSTPASAKGAIHDVVKQAFSGLSLPIQNLGHKFQMPKADDWASWQKAMKPTKVFAVPYTHIHDSKGLEYTAVLLHIPHERTGGVVPGLDAWAADIQSEARQVLYVGASRAKRLLVLSVGVSGLDRLIAILNRDGVVGYKVEQV